MAKALNLLRLEQIRIDGGTQSRVTMNQATIAAYADAMTEGETFPRLLVYFDGADFWLADGFHRFHACKAIGAVDVDCEVIAGSLDDAILRSLGVNALHGLPPTNADKRKSVTTCLANPQWAKWSDKTISEKCGVSRGFVQTVRSSLASDACAAAEQRTYINKHGTESVMKTGGIGGGNKQRADGIIKHKGIAFSALTVEQQKMAAQIILEYVGRARADFAGQEMEAIGKLPADEVFFGYNGGTEAGEAHYFSIQGPTFLLEFANFQNGANHVHASWRDLKKDFGYDPLAAHAKEHK